MGFALALDLGRFEHGSSLRARLGLFAGKPLALEVD